MDRHIDPSTINVSREFSKGVEVFIAFASRQSYFLERKTMFCACLTCGNRKRRDVRTVYRHLYRVGFKSNYYVWSSHGESYYDAGESSTGGQFMGMGNEANYESTPIVPPNDEYVSEDELDEACTDSDSESDSSS
ncbi:hypothetical protein HID58_087193 [Brassica napus]|uniref:Transposase-associated domain-containing protein n=1 Tax=Brassica napus TaxID=3708 RepID=A0ABQ7XSN2_BRANA|nr:hypothetical protein HID58_087193 [Brassica napus]